MLTSPFHNMASSDRLAQGIFKKVDTIAELGLSDVSRHDFGSGIRSIAYRDRVIFFRAAEGELHIRRVPHGHQDISGKDFKQEED